MGQSGKTDTHRIRLIHWNQSEANERADRIRSGGFEVEWDVPSGPDFFRRLNKTPPDAVVIDLSRLPSQGRDAALAIRQYKAMRRIPLVFVGGEPEKVARIQTVLPDAFFTDWAETVGILRRAIAHPSEHPVAVRSRLAGYADTPLAKKLGIKHGLAIVLIGAPDTFKKTIHDFGKNVSVLKTVSGKQDLIFWFVRSGRELDLRMRRTARCVQQGGLWIAWPKKASGLGSDLTQQHVRDAGLASGLVDYKICSIDSIWSGLLFTRRKKKKVDHRGC